MNTIRADKGIYIGDGRPALIVAEISSNHGGSFGRAVSLIRRAKQCGADAVKFQTYTPDTLTIDVDNRFFRIRHPKWGGQTLYQLYKKAYTPWGWFRKLKKIADEEGILFFSTAFDSSAVDLLEEIGVRLHKIASFELVDLALIAYAAKTGKPLMLSTGMATFPEIKEAYGAAGRNGASGIVLMKCVSAYPTSPDRMNLRAIDDLKRIFKCPAGLSDHTLGIGTSVASIACGANVIEKHFTISRKQKTPDSFFSIEPDELKALARNVRVAERAIKPGGGLTGEEKKNRFFRRSLFAIKNIERGEVFTETNIRSIRPGYGMPPKYLKWVLGRRAKRKITRGTPISTGLVKK